MILKFLGRILRVSSESGMVADPFGVGAVQAHPRTITYLLVGENKKEHLKVKLEIDWRGSRVGKHPKPPKLNGYDGYYIDIKFRKKYKKKSKEI